MNLTDLLSYTDIDALRDLATQCKCKLSGSTYSKHELIRSLLSTMQRPSWWERKIQQLTVEERRFWQLLCFDSRETYNMEELIGKGRQAYADDEGNPRTLVARAIKSGLIFSDRSLFRIPKDVRKQVIRAFLSDASQKVELEPSPDVYREEENCLVSDLYAFLVFVGERDVRLTVDHAIYRRDLQTLLAQMAVREEPVVKGRWRFGFGRRYHQYPDRFSLLYDYAYYAGYIAEMGQKLRLCVDLLEQNIGCEEEGEQLYRFWLRLYRRSIPALPIIVSWVYLLSQEKWVSKKDLKQYLSPWLHPFYYMTREQLFELVLKMLLHLGVIRVGQSAIQMTEKGEIWVRRTTGSDLSDLEGRFTSLSMRETFF